MTAGVNWKPSLVTLVDGTQVLSDSEPWRFECEARYVLDMPDRESMLSFLDGEFNPKAQVRTGGLVKSRGFEYVERLKEKVRELWYARKAAAKAVA